MFDNSDILLNIAEPLLNKWCPVPLWEALENDNIWSKCVLVCHIHQVEVFPYILNIGLMVLTHIIELCIVWVHEGVNLLLNVKKLQVLVDFWKDFAEIVIILLLKHNVNVGFLQEGLFIFAYVMISYERTQII